MAKITIELDYEVIEAITQIAIELERLALAEGGPKKAFKLWEKGGALWVERELRKAVTNGEVFHKSPLTQE